MLILKLFVLLPLAIIAGAILGGLISIFIGVSSNQLIADITFWLAMIISSFGFFIYLNNIFTDPSTQDENFVQRRHTTPRKHSSSSFLLGYLFGKYYD